ncbi:MAG TPA: hypothetical protein PLW44_07050 [Chitinophagales bacterium]|nr:hypothetical protein [Chitinophagales bacterium]
MSDTQITLEFLANTDGLKAATQQMQLLGKVSKEQYALFVKANRDAQQAMAAMAKETTATGKAVSETATRATQLSTQYRQMAQFIATGAVSELISHFVGLAAQLVANSDKLTELNNQLSQLQQTINSGELEGEALAKAKDNAAGLLEQVKNATEASAKLAQGLNSTKVYGEALNAVVAGLAAAQSGSALFGTESERLQQALLKAQQATAFLSSAQQTYGATLRIVEAIQKEFAVSSAAAWAAATGGVSLLITGLIAVKGYFDDIDAAAAKGMGSVKTKAEEAAEAVDYYTRNAQRAAGQAKAYIDDLNDRVAKYIKDQKITESTTAETELKLLKARESFFKQEKKRFEDLAAIDQVFHEVYQEVVDNLDRRIAETHKRYGNLLGAVMKEQIKAMKDAEQFLENELGITAAKGLEKFKQSFDENKIEEPLITESSVNATEVNAERQADLIAINLQLATKYNKDYIQSIENDWQKLTDFINDPNSSPYLVQLAQIAKTRLELQLFVQYAQQASDTLFQIVSNQIQAELQAQQQKLTKQRELELQNKNLTEQQKDAINKRYADQEAKLKRKAYEQDKASKMAQAAINGALAITNILATLPKTTFGVLDAIMIASAVATTAAQIGIIASTPIPAFKQGGKNIPAGMKLVGEEGSELIYTPGGETVIPHGDTAKILEAWSIPVPNVNPALKTDMAIAAALPAGIDYNKLAVVLAQELRNNPSVNISMDNAGFAMHLIEKNKAMHLLNNRYSA